MGGCVAIPGFKMCMWTSFLVVSRTLKHFPIPIPQDYKEWSDFNRLLEALHALATVCLLPCGPLFPMVISLLSSFP